MSTHLSGARGQEPGAAVARLDPAAFAAQYQACARALWCIAAGVLGRRQEADDVLQDAAMIALGKLNQFDATTSFVAWMGRIVRYVALNQVRRQVRFSAMDLDAHTLQAGRDGPGPAAMPGKQGSPGATGAVLVGRGELADGQDLFDDRVLAALRGLDETARACLLLRTVMDMPYRQIAVALDIPEGTAMSHVHRARTEMRRRLTDHPPVTKGAGNRT